MKNWRIKNLIAGLIVFTLAFSLFGYANAEVDPDFDPNNLLSDEEMLDYQSMTLKDIESFLAGKDGVLKNYVCREIEIEKAKEVENTSNTNNTNNGGEVEGGQACSDYLNPANSVCLIDGPGWCPDGQNNDSLQVKKVQNFFNDYYKDIILAATGVFNRATFDAAIRFQNEYKAEILTKCGLTNATGYVGPSTIAQINKLYCQKFDTWSGSLGVAAESDDNSSDDKENKKTEMIWRCFMKSSPLPKKETDGREWTAAEVIYNLAREYKVNPKVILVTLQKEQSLIDNPNPPQGLEHALDWAMGYGCLERGGWNEKLKGFYQQVDGASWQFRRYFDCSDSSVYIQKGVIYYGGIGTSGLDDVLDITPVNQATAALYSYTPHVFNGNYNFWKFWREYFGEVKGVSNSVNNEIVLDPNLLQNSNTPLYYLDGGLKRSLGGLSEEELSKLGFDKNRATPVSLKIINSYPTGKKIKYGLEGNLLENSAGEIYLIENGKKRKFYSEKSVEDSGYQLSQIKKDTGGQLDYYLPGETMLFPDGALIKTDGPAVYKIENGERKAFTSPALFETLGCRWEEIIKVDESELANYPNGSSLKYPDGALIRAVGYEKVYLIENGKANWIKTAAEFIKGGYDWGEVVEVSEGELKLYL